MFDHYKIARDGMRFDGNDNSFLKKRKFMNTGTHMIDYENVLIVRLYYELVIEKLDLFIKYVLLYKFRTYLK